MQRDPSFTIIHVSYALSKIPYVGFSPVRLQEQVVQIKSATISSPLSPIRHTGYTHNFTLPLAPIQTGAFIRGNSISAVSGSALCPPQPVHSHALEAITSPPLVSHSGTPYTSLRSCSQGSFAKRGYSVRLYLCYYNPIRQSDRLLPISVFNPYTGGLCHSRIDPDCLSHLPQFNLRLLAIHTVILTPSGRFGAMVCYFPKRISLRLQRRGSTPDSCPRHLHWFPRGQLISRGCNVRFMLRPV